MTDEYKAWAETLQNCRAFAHQYPTVKMTTYKIVRMYFDSQSSSKTCRKPHNVRRTRERGAWFDGYEEE